MTDNGWDWFETENNTLSENGTGHWKICFDSAAGSQVLANLEQHFLQTTLGPDASNKAIWMREGKRALVLQIKRLAQGSKED